MPLIDMTLDELYEYRGRNPRPADFEDYWDRALSELDATAPNPDLTRHEYKSHRAEAFDLTFTGVGGARIHAKYLRPSPLPAVPLPAVLLFHGYAGSSGDWFDKLSWVSQGYCVAAMDCRGQGGQSEDSGAVLGNTLRGHIIRGLDDSPDKMLFRQIFLDTAQLARVIMALPEVDEDRVGATGASQGGGLTLACAALEPRIRKAAPIYPFLCDYKRVWEMDLADRAYEELRSYFRSFDPLHERENEVWERLGYIDNQHLAPRIQAEVRMAVGLMDTICPPSTQFAAYNRIRARKELLIYPDFAHETLPGCADRIFEFMADL
jgi:cephalosporin-C deacetylase